MAGVAGLNRPAEEPPQGHRWSRCTSRPSTAAGAWAWRWSTPCSRRRGKAAGLALLVLTVTAGNRQAAALYERAASRSFGIEPDAIRVNGVPFAAMYLQPHPPPLPPSHTP
jgi:hypothetical protein